MTLVLAGVLPLAAGLFISLWQGKQTMKSVMGEGFHTLARESSDKLDLVLSEEIAEIRQISQIPVIKDVLLAHQSKVAKWTVGEAAEYDKRVQEEWKRGGPLARDILENPASQQLHSFLKDDLDAGGNATVALFLTDVRGQLVASVNSQPELHLPQDRLRMMQVGKPYWGYLRKDEETDFYVFDTAYPVEDGNGVILGFVIRTYSPEAFLGPTLSRVRFGETGHLMVIDQDGSTVQCPLLPTGSKVSDWPLLQDLVLPQSGWMQMDFDGHGGREEAMFGYAPLFELNQNMNAGRHWHLVAWQTAAELSTPMRAFFRWNTTAGLVAMALIAMIGGYASTRITRPITRLEEAVHQLEEGRATASAQAHAASSGAPAEISRLSESFARMADNLQKSRDEERKHLTELRATLEELTRAREQADKANRAKSEFLSRMNHELRTPLNAILGFGQLLEHDPRRTLSDTQHDQVRHILRTGNHLLQLINEALDLSRVESGLITFRKEPVALSSLLQEAVHITQPLAEKAGILLHDRCGNLQAVVDADPMRLKQCVLNLLSNGIKYNKPNGSVTLSCRPLDPGFVEISVADTGRGIPEDRLPMLFQPFERLGADHAGVIEGTGIGLAITKKLMELMGGGITVKNRAGEGCEFLLKIPLVKDAVPIAAAVPKKIMDEVRTPSAREQKEKSEKLVLYVEDNKVNQLLVQYIFHQRPQCQLVFADNGVDGLMKAEEISPDLILLDIQMPGLDGIEVVRKLRESRQHAKTPVIAISAKAAPDDINLALDAGFNDYLVKPLQVGKLLEFVDRYLDTAPQ